MPMQIRNYYDDEYANRHFTDKLLGQGGQGAVYRTKDKNTALKLIFVDDNNNIPLLNKEFHNIILRPIPCGLHIAMPKAVLKDAAGYIMPLMEDMQPFADIDKFTVNTNSDDYKSCYWIKQYGNNNPELAENLYTYIGTGGLRRRLSALLKTACILSGLHATGLVYCDINPNNEFLSADKDFMSVWFIDADNINFSSKIRKPLYFPDYGAPEIMRCETNTFFSDCYSFAILAFKALTKSHPFRGKALLEDSSGEDDWESDDETGNNAETKMQQGLLPWIGDEEDDSNSGETIIPYPYLLTQDVLNLFNITFSEKCRNNPKTRPSAMSWAYALAKVCDTNIVCKNCGMGFCANDDVAVICPWCDCQSTAVIEATSYRLHGNKVGNKIWSYVRELLNGNTLKMPARVVNGFLVSEEESVSFEIKYDNGKIAVSNCDAKGIFYIAENNGKFKKILGTYETKSKEIILLCKQEKNFDSLIKCQVRDEL